MTSRNQGLSSNDKGRKRRESLGTRLTLVDGGGLHVHHVMVDELLKEYGHGSRIVMSKYLILLKIELRILDFRHFHWLAGHRFSAHIPALPNMVNERVSK